MFGTTVRLPYKSCIFWVAPYGGNGLPCAAVLAVMNHHFGAYILLLHYASLGRGVRVGHFMEWSFGKNTSLFS